MERFLSLGSELPAMPEEDEPAWLRQLLATEAPFIPATLLPEILVPQCHNLTGLWEAVEAARGAPLEHAPFWATAWPGGIALARWILDNRGRFRSKRVLDLGCGSGIAGIAAALAGARVVLNEVDPLALCVARVTARTNHVNVTLLLKDLQLRELEEFEIVLVADGFYERPRASRLVRMLELCAARGATVLAADASRHITDLPGSRTYEIEVPVSPDIEGCSTRLASVHLLEP